MTAVELKKELATGRTDYEFFYNGEKGSICPYNMPDGSFKAHVIFSNQYREFSNLDELMSIPFLNGKNFSEVAEEVELYG